MAGKTYTDNKALQVKMKMINVALMEEWAIINGNSTIGAGLQFDGLDQNIITNITDLAGANLTFIALTTTMRNIVTLGGKPQFVLMSLRHLQKISELILASYYRLTQVGAGALADIPAGVACSKWVSPFGTVDLLGSRFITTPYNRASIFVCDDKSMTQDGKALAIDETVAPSSNTRAINRLYRWNSLKIDNTEGSSAIEYKNAA